MNALIEAQGLMKYFGSVQALDGLDLTVPEGAIYALVGPNGAGKTTLLRTLLNIYSPLAGTARVLGVDSRHLKPEHFAQIGFVAETTQMPDWMRVEEYLAYLRPFYPTWDDAYAAQLLRQFDLPADRRLRDLSKGMRMKAALASSLAYHPRLLLLDEPFSGLDAVVRDDFIRGILDQPEPLTILISSHDLAEIESFSSHFGYLEAGRIHVSEELSELTARFREVTVTYEADAPSPAPWPDGWLLGEANGNCLRFTASRWQDTEARIRALGGAVRSIESEPMSLRAIFVALARSRRPQ